MNVEAQQFLTSLLRDVGSVLTLRFKEQAFQVRRKADRSLVTDADFLADQQLGSALGDRYPDDGLLSEERGLIRPGKTGCIWVIDPLDGTTNFSLGLPIWGISIARVGPEGPELAGLHFPLLGELYSARRGEGAFLNGKAIHVQPYQENQPAAFFSCCTRAHRRYHVRVPYKTRILGSAAYSFCAVARGSAALAFEATPKIWDLAGGWLLMQEAGGTVELYDSTAPFPLGPAADLGRSLPTLAAADAKGLEQARKWIQRRENRT